MSNNTSSRPTSLLLFTTSQTPLASRYPHPAKPSLLLPPLVHTTLHNALDSDIPSWSVSQPSGSDSTSAGTTVIIPNPKSLGPNGANGTLSAGLSQKSSLASLKSSAFGAGGSVSPTPSSPTFQDEEKERLDNEVTVKFYIIGSGSGSASTTPNEDDEHGYSNVAEQKAWIQEGLDVLEKYKRPTWAFGSGPPSQLLSHGSDDARSERTSSPTGSASSVAGKIDTFLLGWKGVDYIGKKTESATNANDGAEVENGDDEGEDQTPRKRQPGCGSAKLASREEAETEREERGGIELTEGKKREMVELWKSLGDLVPNAVQLGTLSLPLPLLKLLHSESNGVSPLGSSTDVHAQAQNGSRVPPAAKPSASGDEEATISSMSSSDPVAADDASHVASSPTSASYTDRSLLSSLLDSTNGGITTVPTLSGSESDQLAALAKRHDARTKLGQVRKPKVNSLNTPDCHSLPEGLMKWAKAEGVELWAGGSGIGSDPMPSIHLHNTLAEFVPQFPADLVSEKSNLGKIVAFPEDGNTTPALGVDVRWVMSYTVISRTRNVVKDKGYIISAALL